MPAQISKCRFLARRGLDLVCPEGTRLLSDGDTVTPRPEGVPRKGLQNSAQGFNPGNTQNKRLALTLTGRQDGR